MLIPILRYSLHVLLCQNVAQDFLHVPWFEEVLVQPWAVVALEAIFEPGIEELGVECEGDGSEIG